MRVSFEYFYVGGSLVYSLYYILPKQIADDGFPHIAAGHAARLLPLAIFRSSDEHSLSSVADSLLGEGRIHRFCLGTAVDLRSLLEQADSSLLHGQGLLQVLF